MDEKIRKEKRNKKARRKKENIKEWKKLAKQKRMTSFAGVTFVWIHLKTPRYWKYFPSLGTYISLS